MYKAITITLLSLWSITLDAQVDFETYLETFKPYKIHLKDGTVLRGVLIEEEKDFIELELSNDSMVTVPTKDIVDLVKFKAPFPELSNYDDFDDLPNGTSYRKAGSFIIFQLGLVPDRNSNNFEEDSKFRPTFTVINGYMFERGFALGLGMNFDVYNKSFFPIFVDFRKYFKRRPVSTFISFDYGYGFAFNQFSGGNNTIKEGGTMMQAGGGIHIATKKDLNLLIELGFRSQAFNKYKSTPFDTGVRIRQHWIFQIGLIF